MSTVWKLCKRFVFYLMIELSKSSLVKPGWLIMDIVYVSKKKFFFCSIYKKYTNNSCQDIVLLVNLSMTVERLYQLRTRFVSLQVARNYLLVTSCLILISLNSSRLMIILSSEFNKLTCAPITKVSYMLPVFPI